MKNLDLEIKEKKLAILKMVAGWIAISYLVGFTWMLSKLWTIMF
jgi:hypothetical protein